jgi:hypothetical protein
MKRACIAIAIMLLPGAAWAGSCYTIGDSVYCSDGSSITGMGGGTYITTPPRQQQQRSEPFSNYQPTPYVPPPPPSLRF